MESNNLFFPIIIAICVFNFCLTLVTLLFVFKLWLDVYHKRWLDMMQEIQKTLNAKK